MVGRTRTRIGALILLSAAAFPMWFFLAPPQLGGSTAYVTTEGTSMEPLFRAGDLVVVRASPTYEVGDVVAYHSRQLHSVVLHRIVAVEGDRYVFKGDSNTWLDSEHPSYDQLIGKMVVRIPGLGRRLHLFTTPAAVSAAVGLGTVGFLGGRKRTVRAKHRRKDRAPEKAPASAGNGRRPNGRKRNGAGGPAALAACSALAVAALALGVLAFVTPTEVATHREAVYEQRGSFSYTAVVPGGRAVYGTDLITTGEPVYLRLIDAVDVAFDYRLESPAPVEASGTARLVARISDVNGWNRTLPLGPPAPFTGQEVTVRGVLDLAGLERMTATLERLTGVERDQYSVSLVPEIRLHGTVAGQPFSKTFAPQLEFLLDDLELQLAPTQVPAPGEGPTHPLNPTAGGLVKIEGTAPNAFRVFGLEAGVASIRIGCLGAEILALVGLLMIAASRFRAARRGEAALIEARFGRWLVPVRGSGTTAGRTVDVESFDGLAQLAAHYGQVILHEERNGSDVYLVEDEGVTYRYRVRPNGSGVRRR